MPRLRVARRPALVGPMISGCPHDTYEGQRTRGMCPSCYRREHYRGTHIDFPSKQRKRADVIEDCLFIHRTHGGSPQQIADRMGMKLNTLRKVFRRAGIPFPGTEGGS